MNAARTGGREADAELPRVFRVAAGHEGCGLFVPHLDEADMSLLLAQRFHDSIDAVARQTEDDTHAPFAEGLNENIGGGNGHLGISSRREIDFINTSANLFQPVLRLRGVSSALRPACSTLRFRRSIMSTTFALRRGCAGGVSSTTFVF